MPARALRVLPLVVMVTGCLHTMGSAGFISMALHKDMSQSERPCKMSTDVWLEICDNRGDKTTSSKCPKECRPPPEAD
jgi:hypothetical protein